jgi:hypothetical protein
MMIQPLLIFGDCLFLIGDQLMCGLGARCAQTIQCSAPQQQKTLHIQSAVIKHARFSFLLSFLGRRTVIIRQKSDCLDFWPSKQPEHNFRRFGMSRTLFLARWGSGKLLRCPYNEVLYSI